jgi:hypothetical protein
MSGWCTCIRTTLICIIAMAIDTLRDEGARLAARPPACVVR